MKVRKTRKWAALALAGVAALFSRGPLAHAATPVFDWSVTDNSGNANYTPSPVLSNDSVSSVVAFLTARHAGNPSAPLAVKVLTPISSSTAAAVFDHFKINYVFADLETTNPINDTKHLVNPRFCAWRFAIEIRVDRRIQSLSGRQ